MLQILAAAILAGGAFFGVYKGAVYAVWRLGDQLAEERRLSEERLEAESQRFQRQLDAEADRLQSQLDAESERLQAQLDAESQRLGRQLTADRDRQDRAELRDLLDDGVRLFEEGNDYLWSIEIEIDQLPAPGADDPQGDQPLMSLEAPRPIVKNLGSFWQRTMIRFRTSDSIPSSVTKGIEAFDQAIKTAEGQRKHLSEERRRGIREKREEFSDAYAAFLAECRSRFGVRDLEE